MKPIVTKLLTRSLMTLSAIFVWAKTLARGSATSRAGAAPANPRRPRVPTLLSMLLMYGQTRSILESDQTTAGGRQKSPTVNPGKSLFEWV